MKGTKREIMSASMRDKLKFEERTSEMSSRLKLRLTRRLVNRLKYRIKCNILSEDFDPNAFINESLVNLKSHLLVQVVKVLIASTSTES